ncbi:MAG TPA: T9SS type A sorting domain-containing protein, partial [Chryseolinea sp.]|nr:T9SS type A sorting domain-containing protein [Chryseolinea sp.]
WINLESGQIRHYAQKISPNGQLQWTPGGVLVCPATVSQVVYYQLISDGQGGAILLWDDSRAGPNQVFAQRIDGNGTLQWLLNGLPCTPQYTFMSSYEAVPDSTGGMILCWIINTGLISRNDVFVQHFSHDGTPLWGAGGKNICNANSDQLFCKIAKDADDNVIVIWQDFRLDPVWSQIYGQRIDSAGNIKWQTDGSLLADSVSPTPTVAKIATDTRKGAIITWLDDFMGGQSTIAHLRAVRVDSTGSFVWMKKEVATWQELQLPADYKLVADFNGGCFISWTKVVTYGLGAYDVYDLGAQHVFADGLMEFGTNGKNVSSVPMNQYYQQLVSDSNGVAIVAWSDLRNNSDYDLYAMRITELTSLPVTWLHFSGSMNGSTALLTWETVDELNNKGFTVQRSYNGIDFENIGFIPASELAQERYAYTFTDLQPYSGFNYYRLQQKDIDGRTSLSHIIRLNFGSKNFLSVYPNPASRYFKVRGINAGSIISIYGMDGKKYTELRSSGSSMEIDISKMPRGIYSLRVTGDNNSHSLLVSIVD